MTKKTTYSAELLGLHGLDQEFKLAHLPFLVVDDIYGVLAFQGSSGTGKTTLVERLGALNKKAGGGSYGVYSADKVQYEDFVGMPVPTNLEGDNPEIKVIPMEHSIAKQEVILIDELNRATYENQEKFLSLFASRQIDGNKVACKYMYVAMNPVMTKQGESYEGTQPLDKALGERIMFLINMPGFGQLPIEAKMKLITASNKQTKWQPSDELVKLHKEFIEEAKAKYEEIKEKFMEPVAQYIVEVETRLRNEGSGIKLEGRRAQFILTNILGIYALDSVFNGSANLEKSALQGLIGSFPNTLWYQEVNIPGLKEAHNDSVHYLDLDDENTIRSFRNDSRVARALKEIVEAAQSGDSVENISKLTNMNWPNKEEDPAGHFIYAFGVVAGLQGRRGSQNVLKEQEFSRFVSACSPFKDNQLYKYYSKVQQHYIDTGKFPDNYQRPTFIETAPSDEALEQFDEAICSHSDAVLFTMALMDDYPDLDAQNYSDFETLYIRVGQTIKAFNTVSRHYTGA